MLWDRAILALTLLAIDPKGLGGIVVRARPSPVRSAFQEALEILPQPLSRVHPAMDNDALFGGIDLTETLRTGQMTHREGVLGTCGTAILTMAERCEAGLAARLSMLLDTDRSPVIVAWDEGADVDETVPTTLSERLAFSVTLEFGQSEVGLLADPDAVSKARQKLGAVRVPIDIYTQIATVCGLLGVDSQRAALFTLAAARAHAAMVGGIEVSQSDVEVAAALVLAHRATHLPSPEVEAEDIPPPDDTDDSGTSEGEISQLEDRIVEAVLASLPDGMLDQIATKARAGRGSGAGAKHRGNRRGRPVPSRPGRLSGQNRLDLIATLRTAAPWQKLRGVSQGKVAVLPADFRIKRFEEKSDRLLIFAVDASGSAAIARLSEAKGAVELLLAEAYSRRDHVSLISFRGSVAETLLPPTRSLVQTKRRLAALPGGGGTPLAAGLVQAMQLANKATRQGMSPCIVLLTDGRANIALDGSADRSQAAKDAKTIARQLRASGCDGLVLDLGNRPAAFLSELAALMDASYLPLPRANAHKVSQAVQSVIGG